MSPVLHPAVWSASVCQLPSVYRRPQSVSLWCLSVAQCIQTATDCLPVASVSCPVYTDGHRLSVAQCIQTATECLPVVSVSCPVYTDGHRVSPCGVCQLPSVYRRPQTVSLCCLSVAQCIQTATASVSCPVYTDGHRLSPCAVCQLPSVYRRPQTVSLWCVSVAQCIQTATDCLPVVCVSCPVYTDGHRLSPCGVCQLPSVYRRPQSVSLWCLSVAQCIQTATDCLPVVSVSCPVYTDGQTVSLCCLSQRDALLFGRFRMTLTSTTHAEKTS